jgi:hypothetical protein
MKGQSILRATVTEVLSAVQTFVDEHGSLPANAGDWHRIRNHDRRFPSWPTIRRAGFRSMSELADALGLWTDGVQWNRGRVLDGLRRFAAEHGEIPGATHTYHLMVKGNSSVYPSFYQVLKFFDSFEEAARIADVPITWNKGAKRDWNTDEDNFLRAFVGTATVAELQRAIGRHSAWAVDRRLYDLSLTQRTGQGRWTMLRTANALAIRLDRLAFWEDKKAIQVSRESHFAFIDPGELPDFLLIQGNSELRAAALSQRRRRLVSWLEYREVNLVS